MINNPNNTKYKSALDNLPFEVRKADEPGRKMESQKFYLHPVLRDPPDIECLGRAILELAKLSCEQSSAEKTEEDCTKVES